MWTMIAGIALIVAGTWMEPANARGELRAWPPIVICAGLALLVGRLLARVVS